MAARGHYRLLPGGSGLRAAAAPPAARSQRRRAAPGVAAALLLSAAALAAALVLATTAWVAPLAGLRRRTAPSADLLGGRQVRRPDGLTLRRNWLEMLEDAVGVPTPQRAEPAIPASRPIDAAMVHNELTAYVLEEKGISMSGEDFEVKAPSGEVLLKIGGGNRLPIPGMPVWDKLTMSTVDGQAVASLDRQAFTMTATYDLNRADGSKFGRISKSMFAFTQTFELWEEGDSSGPLLKAEGSFSDKKYSMKCRAGTVVASVARLPGFSGNNVDSYQVVVGPNVDASLVLAMAVVIDEVHDEENPATGGEGLPDMLEDAQGLPMPQAASPPIPSGRPPLDAVLMHAGTTAYELEEKAFSMFGEDFEVKSPAGELMLKIGGGNRIPIAGMPVWDKLTVSSASGEFIATLDREMISMTPTYDVYRADGSKFGTISKAMFGFTEAFEFFLEGDGGGPVLRAEGSFSERKYSFKSREGAIVATVGRGYYQTDNENRYHCIVGANVDASLVLAMAVAIDEVHDEEDAAKGEKKEEGGWPFR
mmetsp:Transcript_18428/g.46460  ORF Transcript_18428/g.46460 Transcript_18428/m.46460 type:complete len:535 (+) Transcript_18428:66-1670(+)